MRNIIIHYTLTAEVLHVCPRCQELSLSPWEATADEGWEGILQYLDYELLFKEAMNKRAVVPQEGDTIIITGSVFIPIGDIYGII